MTEQRASNRDAPKLPVSVIRSLPSGIWVLGFGSMFMDISSEIVHSLLPLFMVNVLGTSMIVIGIVEGVAEGTASITKVFSGMLSDHLGKRKFLLLLGYGLGCLTKPIFPMAASVQWVFAARFIDRIGKGIRGAPRDALVADLTLPSLRGAAYGLRQTLDAVGSFLGPLLAIALMMLLHNDIRAVLWVAVIPAFFTVALLFFFIKDPNPNTRPATGQKPFSFAGARQLPAGFWLVVFLGGLLTLARFSEAFLVLRVNDVGLALELSPLVLVVMNLFYAAFAYPAGAASDHISRRALMIFGLSLLVAADLVLATGTSPLPILIGSALWGLHMAFTQGLLAKLIADTAPSHLRGTAFGIFNLVSGIALLVASLVAGSIWSAYGPASTFFTGAIFTALATLGLTAYSWKHQITNA